MKSEVEDELSQKENKIQELVARERQLVEEGRRNEEKCMGQLAMQIKVSEDLKKRLEEGNQLVLDRNKSIEELMDKLEAQRRLISSRDDVIEQLKQMKDLSGGNDELVSALQEQLVAMSGKIEQLVEKETAAKQQVKELQQKLEQANNLLAAKEKVCTARLSYKINTVLQYAVPYCRIFW